MRPRTLAVLLLVAFIYSSCKKERRTELPISADTAAKVTIPDPVDSLLGSYIGDVMIVHLNYAAQPVAGTPNLWSDTTYYADTIYISKHTSDSFNLENKDWYTIMMKNGYFKYNEKNTYSPNDPSGNLSLAFFPSSDGLMMQRVYGNYNGNGFMQITYHFGGKR